MSLNVYPDRHSVTVRIGWAPEGSTTTEWDWVSDGAYGKADRYEYDLVPGEAVTPVDEEQVTLSGPDYTFEDIKAYARGLVEALSWEGTAPAGMAQVFSVTASHKSGWSFVATTWNELPLTLASLV